VERLRAPMRRICDYILQHAGVEPSAKVLPFVERTRSGDASRGGSSTTL
jgi:hypothetical protein